MVPWNMLAATWVGSNKSPSDKSLELGWGSENTYLRENKTQD